MTPKAKMTSEEKKNLAMEALSEKKAVDPVVIDVHNRTLLTDYIIVASGTSRPHIKSLVDGVVEKLADSGIKGKRVEGLEEVVWVLIDYGDLVVHVMSPEQREFYRLEAYWSGSEKGSPPPLSPEEVQS